MTLTALLIVAMVAIVPDTHGVPPSQSPEPAARVRQADATADAVRSVAAERSAALVRKDVAALDRILAPEFVYTNASGEVLDKEKYLARYVRDPNVRWLSQELEDVEVRVAGDIAVVTCRVRDRAEFGGQSLDAAFRSTYVYVREEEGWRCIAGHTGPAAQ
jgi:ketosteroid isomerase-like protein